MIDHDKILEIIRLKDQVPIALDPQKTALQAFSLAFGRVRKTEAVIELLSVRSSQ